MRGTFYGIGVGPGDPELLTIKAANILKTVDVIIAPKTEKKEGSVAYNIAQPYLKKDIDDFVGGADQFDDITIMAMQIN